MVSGVAGIRGACDYRYLAGPAAGDDFRRRAFFLSTAGAAMIASRVIAEIRRLLAQKRLGHRRIAELTGVSRNTVGAVATGRRPDYEDLDDPDSAGPPRRCPGCGGMVYLPCRLCRTRSLLGTSGRAVARQPGTDAGAEPLALQLKEAHRRRYEEVRRPDRCGGPLMRQKPSDLILVSYPSVRHHIRDSDLLLFRCRDLIAIAGRGEHCHAAKAAWWGNDLFCLEVRQWFGGRAVTLSSQVARWPGRIDVFQANPDNRWPHYDRAGAVRLCGGCAAASTATRRWRARPCCTCRWSAGSCGRTWTRRRPTAARRFAARPARWPTGSAAASIRWTTCPTASPSRPIWPARPFYRYRFTLTP